MKVYFAPQSRAVRTVWLLEEIGREYKLERFTLGQKEMRGPDYLKVNPNGRVPTLEDGDVRISESTAIAKYIGAKYAPELTPRPSDPNFAEYLQWLHYSEASAFAPLLLNMLLMREDPKPPVISAFTAAEVKLHLDYFSASLGDQDYILGAFSGADIGCAFVANMAVKFGLAGGHPNLGAYVERCKARPAFQRAMEKTGG